MERTMLDESLRGEIERFSQPASHWQRLRQRQRASLASHDVERVAGEVILRQIGNNAVETGRDGSRNRGMSKLGLDQPLEFGDQLMDALGGQVEPENFDGNEAIALGFVRTKHRP
jgi:hypothetical protein